MKDIDLGCGWQDAAVFTSSMSSQKSKLEIEETSRTQEAGSEIGVLEAHSSSSGSCDGGAGRPWFKSSASVPHPQCASELLGSSSSANVGQTLVMLTLVTMAGLLPDLRRGGGGAAKAAKMSLISSLSNSRLSFLMLRRRIAPSISAA